MQEKISIIIPIFNAEKYLERCIKSVLNQTYKNFEAILVDDGSTDNSCLICDNYALKDKRLKIIHKKNGGVSSARNIGVENSEGKYIVFIDADDFIDTDCLETFINYSQYDFVMCGFKEYIQDDEKKEICHKLYIANNNEQTKNIALQKEYIDFISFPWMKMLKTSIIKNNNIVFNEKIDYAEDTCFILEYLAKCNNAIIIEKPLYNYSIVNGSLSRKYIKDIRQKLENIIVTLRQNKYTLKALQTHIFRNVKTEIFNERWTKYKNFKKICIELKQIIKENQIKFEILYADKKSIFISICLKFKLYKILYYCLRIKGKSKKLGI